MAAASLTKVAFAYIVMQLVDSTKRSTNICRNRFPITAERFSMPDTTSGWRHYAVIFDDQGTRRMEWEGFVRQKRTLK